MPPRRPQSPRRGAGVVAQRPRRADSPRSPRRGHRLAEDPGHSGRWGKLRSERRHPCHRRIEDVIRRSGAQCDRPRSPVKSRQTVRGAPPTPISGAGPRMRCRAAAGGDGRTVRVPLKQRPPGAPCPGRRCFPQRPGSGGHPTTATPWLRGGPTRRFGCRPQSQDPSPSHNAAGRVRLVRGGRTCSNPHSGAARGAQTGATGTPMRLPRWTYVRVPDVWPGWSATAAQSSVDVPNGVGQGNLTL